MSASVAGAASTLEPQPPAPDGAGRELRFRVVRREAVDDREIARLLAAITESFGSWPSVDPGVPPAEHLRWKMASPAGDLAAIVGEIGEELACCQVCVSQRVRIAGEVVSRVRSADFAVRPAFRGRRAASELSAVKTRVLGRPTLRLTETRHPAILHLTRKGGGVPLGNPVGALLLPLDARRMGEQRGGGWRGVPGRILPAALAVASRWRRRGRPLSPVAHANGFSLRRIARFDQSFAAFCEDACRAFDVAVERTPDYLDWRFCDPRAGSWCVDAVVEDGAVAGYVAWRVVDGRGFIGDLLVLPDRLAAVGALVDAAVAGAAAEGAASVLCWLPVRHPYRRALGERGFLGRAARVTHLFRPESLSAQAAALLAASATRIHLTLGDSDFL